MSSEQIQAAIRAAAEQVGAKVADMDGYYRAGGDWDADTVEGLTELLVECWEEQEKEENYTL